MTISLTKNIQEFNVEFIIITILILTLSFFQVNVNEQLGNIFSLMLIIFFIIAIILSANTDVRNIIAGNFIRRNNNWTQSLLSLAGAFAIFTFVGNYLVSSFSMSVFEFLADQAPILSADPWLNFVMIGQIVPFVESMLFFGALVSLIILVGLKAKETLDFSYKKILWVFTLITLIFVVYHYSAKFAQGITAFLVTGLFALISIFLVLINKQMFEAVAFHLILNSNSMRGTIDW